MANSRVKFKQWDCVVNYAKYGNGATAITLSDANDGEPIATCSVNIVEEQYDKTSAEILKIEGLVFSGDLPANQCFIKTWSENDGMDIALREAGIIGPQLKALDVNGFGSLAVVVEIIDPNFPGN